MASSGTISDITSNSFKWTFGDSANVTITLTSKVATTKKSVDLTTLSGWANLSAGTHTIKIKAKGTGYKDSELSVGVTVSKAASTVTLEAGTYKWIDYPNIDIVLDRVDIAFTVSGTSYKAITINQGIKYTSRFTVTAFPTSSGGWADDVYKTITLDTSQTVSAEFYNWAITDGNLVKQATGETWLLNETLTESNQDFTSLNFTSNSQSFVRIVRQYDNRPTPEVNSLIYYKSDNTSVTALTTDDDGNVAWTNSAYRTLTFSTAPTGDLLTWLQANATAQS